MATNEPPWDMKDNSFSSEQRNYICDDCAKTNPPSWAHKLVVSLNVAQMSVEMLQACRWHRKILDYTFLDYRKKISSSSGHKQWKNRQIIYDSAKAKRSGGKSTQSSGWGVQHARETYAIFWINWFGHLQACVVAELPYVPATLRAKTPPCSSINISILKQSDLSWSQRERSHIFIWKYSCLESLEILVLFVS